MKNTRAYICIKRFLFVQIFVLIELQMLELLLDILVFFWHRKDPREILDAQSIVWLLFSWLITIPFQIIH